MKKQNAESKVEVGFSPGLPRLALAAPLRAAVLVLAGLALVPALANADQSRGSAQPMANTKTIVMVLTSWRPAMRDKPDGNEECPAGLQFTNRDNFNKQFATDEAREKFTKQFVHLAPMASSGDVVNPEAYLMLRGEGGVHVGFNPTAVADALPLRLVQSKVAYGLNLDGTTDGAATENTCPHEKFVSPEGEKGVDNQLYRLIGCTSGWRADGVMLGFTEREFQSAGLNRILVEISNVVDERNSDNVLVNIYKGIDALSVDASGKPIAWLTQRIDPRYPQFVTQTRGRIVNGVLETEPVDQRFALYQLLSEQERHLRGMRIRLSLEESNAKGLVAGYEELRQWWSNYAKSFAAIANEDGLWSPPAMYAAAHELADGYPDPKTKQCTAISAAYEVEAVRAFIVHPTPGDPLSTDPEMSLAKRTLSGAGRGR